MTKRTLRHPFRGDHINPRPASDRVRRPGRSSRVRQPRMRPRKSLSVTSLVGAPEEQPSRPSVRLNIIAVIVLLLFGVMVLRLWTLQVINHKNYAAAVTATGVRFVTVPAPRGDIVDRNGTELVSNSVQEQIVLSRAAAAAHPSVIGMVAALVGQPPSYVESQLRNVQYSVYQPVPVMFNAPLATVQYLQTHQSQYPGVSVEQVSQRTYPQGGTLAPQVLGYVGAINGTELAEHPDQGYMPNSQIGKTGIEEQYEPALRGTAGQQTLEVDAQGNVISTLHTTAPVKGDTLVLNVDEGLQQAVQGYLANQIAVDRRTPDPTDGVIPKATDGAAIVMDPQNGQVLAMASFPGFDLSRWVGGISQADLDAIPKGAQNNYAIEGLYTPGSTFKLVTATAALQTGLINANYTVDDTGTYTVPGCTGGAGAGCTFHDDDNSGSGEVNVSQALTVSSDYFFYNLGYLFAVKYPNPGPQPVQDTAAQYGEGQITGIDLPDEAQGRVDSLAVREKLHAEYPNAFPNTYWYVGDNVEMAFGQAGTVLTPLEQATTYATFANGGTRYQPQVAAAVVSPAGRVVKQVQPVVTGHVSLPPNVYQPILQGLEGVVETGTAAGAFAGFPLDTFQVAGKTGTASNNAYPGEEPNSWFIAFGPVPDPRYVVLAVIDQGGYGADAAAPVVRNIFDYLLANPVGPVQLPTAAHPPSAVAPVPRPPFGTPTTTTTVPG